MSDPAALFYGMQSQQPQEQSILDKILGLGKRAGSAISADVGQTGRDIQEWGPAGVLAGPGRFLNRPMADLGAPGTERIQGVAGALAPYSPVLGGRRLKSALQEYAGEQQESGPYSGSPITDQYARLMLGAPPSQGSGISLGKPGAQVPGEMSPRDRAMSAEGLSLGPAAKYGRMAFEGLEPPDFQGALDVLGSGPEEPEALSKGEKLARVLGGAARGALAGGGGQPGGSVASVLAGAGGGAAASTGRMQDMERERKDRFETKMMRHRANLASIEARAATAEGETARFNANGEFQAEQANMRVTMEEARVNAPKVAFDNRTGILTYEQVDKDGIRRFHVDDPLKEMRQSLLGGSGTPGVDVYDAITDKWLSSRDMPPSIAAPLRLQTQMMVQVVGGTMPPAEKEMLDDHVREQSQGRYDSWDEMIVKGRLEDWPRAKFDMAQMMLSFATLQIAAGGGAEAGAPSQMGEWNPAPTR